MEESKVKRVFLLTSAMLIWCGSVVANELKIAVPIDEFKQLKSRLEALEKENNQLRQGVGPEGVVAPSTVNTEIQSRLQATENENSRLRQELNTIKNQEHPASTNTEMQARQSEKSSGGEDTLLAARLNAAENENSKLQQEIKTMKEGGVAAVFAESKISARELYFLNRRKGISHPYKF